MLTGVVLILASCSGDGPTGSSPENRDYRQDMRNLVGDLSSWARQQQAGFLIIPQNGQELGTDTGDPDGQVQTAYLAAMDATGREDMFYGYTADDQPTPRSNRTT